MRQSTKRKRKAYFPVTGCVVFLLAIVVAAGLGFGYARYRFIRLFGDPAPWQNPLTLLSDSVVLYLNRSELLMPHEQPNGLAQVRITIEPGESPWSVAAKLREANLIRSEQAFIAMLRYSGDDVALKQGEFLIWNDRSPVQVIEALIDPNSSLGYLVVMPGWRIDEIAESLPTSGYGMDPESFRQLAYNSPVDFAYGSKGQSLEGYLSPGEYRFARDMSAEELIAEMLKRNVEMITPELIQGFTDHHLSVQQAVILASIVQREAVVQVEQPAIAGVFLNRLSAGMSLDADPTVQYAAAGNGANSGWWRVPVTAADLKVDSPYNTYLYPGLPPTAICNPSAEALWAVANAMPVDFMYFQAKCDGSGEHNFALTYEEHVGNSCP